MKPSSLFKFSIIYLIPLVPVVLIYLLFDSLNTFDLEGSLKYAVKAGGPIGAYVFLLYNSSRISKWVLPGIEEHQNYKKRVNRLTGNWTFTAKSYDGDEALGKARFLLRNGKLHITGSFKQANNVETTWVSEFCFVELGAMFYTFNLKTSKGQYSGHARVVLPELQENGESKFSDLNGSWVSIGPESTYGEIAYKRSTVD